MSEGEKLAFQELKKPETLKYSGGTFLLGLDKSKLGMERLASQAETHGFVPKEECHITILGYAAAKMMDEAMRAKGLDPKQRRDLDHDIRNMIQTRKWGFDIRDEWYHIQKTYTYKTHLETGEPIPETRQSYVRMVTVPDASGLITAINAKLGTSIPIPPTHVTLFSTSTEPQNARIGIGINSTEEFANELKRVKLEIR